ncbi:hypothetical protein MMPV_006370 [Pyropia vietnamensis]
MGRQPRSSEHRPPLSATAHGHSDGRGGGGSSRRRSRAGSDGRHLGRHHVACAQGVFKGILHSPIGRAGVIFAFSVFVFLHQTLSLYRPALVSGLTRNLSAVKWPLSWRGGGGGGSRAPLRQANWYRDEGASRPESGSAGASGGGGLGQTSHASAARPGFGVVPVPDGLHPLPSLMTDRAGAPTVDNGGTAGGGAASTHTRFSAWAVSPSMADGVGVPPFLQAAASAPSPGMETAPSSVYTVRKPQGWWGCERPYWVACKGVYRAIKRLDAVSVMDVNCLANADFLPVVFTHLRREFRSIRFVCAERDADRLAAARAKYTSIDAKTSYITFDPFALDAAAAYPPRLDIVLAVGAFVGQSLISSMRLFRSLHTSGAVRYVVFDNYPTLDNAPSVGAADGTIRGGTNKGRINVYKGPFLFPVAKYTYENATEKYGSEENQIMALAVADLFSMSS